MVVPAGCHRDKAKIKPRDMDPRQLKFGITCLKGGS